MPICLHLGYLKERDVPCLLYQGRYSMLVREPESQGILNAVKENGSGFVAFSPLAQGLLTNRYLNGIPDNSRIARGGFLKKEALTPEVLSKIQALNERAGYARTVTGRNGSGLVVEKRNCDFRDCRGQFGRTAGR